MTELAGIQIGLLSIPTHTWPKMLSEPELETLLSVAQELIPDVLTLMLLLFTGSTGDHPVACSDGNASKVGKILLDEHFLDSGIPQKLHTQKTSQTLHTQAELGYNLLHPVIGYCVEGSRSTFGSLTTRNPTHGIRKPKDGHVGLEIF